MQADLAGPRRAGRETGLFLRRWLAHPLRMGSVIPSSATLCRHVVEQAWPNGDDVVLELGSGTGVIARTFLRMGLPPDRLIVVEVDPDLAAALHRSMPGVTVLEGDARRLSELIPERFAGRIGSVVCGIPLVLLPVAEQQAFIGAMDAVAPGRGFVLYSYCVTSPLPYRALRLAARREVWTPVNFPPASVWRYRPVVA